jgi:hypothetical protein
MDAIIYAESVFEKCLQILKEREKYNGVLERTTDIFNEVTNNDMKVDEAYLFLALMKLERLKNEKSTDSLIDMINYLVLYSRAFIKNL